MNSKKMNTGSKDIISSLPDELLCHILSFLSTEDAALTSILSQRWRPLLASVPNLDFDGSTYAHGDIGTRKSMHLPISFKNFVDRVIALQGNASLNKFSLKCEVGSDPSCVDRWIHSVLDRGVVEIHLHIAAQYNYLLPPKVLMSENLVKLKLVGRYKMTIDVREVCLPKLKTLHINDVVFDDGDDETGAAFAKLIFSCHALEELVIINDWIFWESFYVSNPNLKTLTLFCIDADENPNMVSFDTPNLLYLEFSDSLAAQYPKVNFDSLVEASLNLRVTTEDYSEDFFMGISNVKILYLSSHTLEVLAFCGEAIPVFNNLLHLTIETTQYVEWKAMPKLLENCPNLETLVFVGFHYLDTYKCSDVGYRFKDTNDCYANDTDGCLCKPWYGTPIWLSSSPVKTLKIFKFGEINENIDDIDKQLDLIKYFLETMPNLEEVILLYDTRFDYNHRRLTNEFRKLGKVASTKCKIQVIYDNVIFSTTVYSSSSSSGLVFCKKTSRVEGLSLPF